MIDFGVILILFWFFKGRNKMLARLYFPILFTFILFYGVFWRLRIEDFSPFFWGGGPFSLIVPHFIQCHFREAVYSLVMTSPILANSCFGPSKDDNMTINNGTSQFWQNMCFLWRLHRHFFNFEIVVLTWLSKKMKSNVKMPHTLKIS